MDRTSRLRVLVWGPAGVRRRWAAAVADMAGELVNEPVDGLAAAVVHIDSGGPSGGPAQLRQLRDKGVPVTLGVAPLRAARAFEALLAAGAADVVPEGSTAAAIRHRLEQVLAADALGRRVRAQDSELILISSLARRLLRTVEPPSLLAETVDVLGRAFALDEAEVRVLASTERPGSITSQAVCWAAGRGSTTTSTAPLAPEDLESVRRRQAVAADGTGLTVVPLITRGDALAVLRARRAAPFSEAELNTIYGAGNLVAEALGAAERYAVLKGRSRDLEALAMEHQVLFQAVVDALPVSLHAIDRAFRVVVWNRGREAGPLGRPRGEVLGRNLFNVVRAEPELRHEYEDVFATGQPKTSEVLSQADGPPRLYRVEKVPMRLGSDFEVTHVITYARDITAQRSFERSMAQTEKLAAVGRLAAGIAHEINNPLATIAGCAESMKSRLLEPLPPPALPELYADASVIEEEAYRCKEILGGLLDFSRSAPDQRGPCQPAELVRRAVRVLRHNPRVANVRLSLDLPDDVPNVLGNEDQLVQVLLALVINAADATGHGGSVVLRSRRNAAGQVVLSVEDDGPGILPEVRERIFEPFFTTKPPGQGTGLGLSVAYGLVQAHGGQLDVMSHPGLGTRFDIVLPAHSDVLEPAGVTA